MHYVAAALLLGIPGVASANDNAKEWKPYRKQAASSSWIEGSRLQRKAEVERLCLVDPAYGRPRNYAAKTVNQRTGEEYSIICSEFNAGKAGTTTAAAPAAATGTDARE